jgi:hypothetical protein
MLKCKNFCEPICDFCLYFRNGIDLDREETGDGYCLKHFEDKDSLNVCKDFCCFTVGYKENLGMFIRHRIVIWIRRLKYRLGR